MRTSIVVITAVIGFSVIGLGIFEAIRVLAEFAFKNAVGMETLRGFAGAAVFLIMGFVVLGVSVLLKEIFGVD